MTRYDRTFDAPAQRLLQALGVFDIDHDTWMTLCARGSHPSRYDLESFACGSLADSGIPASIGRHVLACPACRAEIEAFRAWLPADGGTNPSTILPFRRKPAPLLFTMPMAAAAAGGSFRQRGGPDATIRLIPIDALPGQVVVAIQLRNPAARPRLIRLASPDNGVIEEALPPPDSQGLVQFVKDTNGAEGRRFLELLLSAPIDFLGATDD